MKGEKIGMKKISRASNCRTEEAIFYMIGGFGAEGEKERRWLAARERVESGYILCRRRVRGLVVFRSREGIGKG